jgi:PAS domain S-box-containing protein
MLSLTTTTGERWRIRTPLPVVNRPWSRDRLLPLLIRYGSALGVIAATILLRLVLDPVLGASGFALFLTGMLLAAWVGGLGPSLVCQTLILFADAYWFRPDRGVHSPLTLQGLVSLVAFYSVGSIVAVLSEAWHAARQRAQVQHAEALSQREQLLTTLSCIADGVVVTDGAGRVTLMNPVAEAMTGWSLDEARGKPARDVFALGDARSSEAIESPIQRVLREQTSHHEAMRLMLTTRNDRQLPVSYSAAPICDAERRTDGVVLVFRDETERLRTEHALRNADQRKDEFLATLAHELRNPLAPIAMGLELMKVSPDDPQTTEEVRSMMERQTQHMVRLIDDLLDVSRITRGKLELRRCEVALEEVVRNALDAVRPTMDESQHRLEVRLQPEPIRLFADPSRLTQVLSNLLNNAAKFTPPGGRIELAARAIDGAVEIIVADNGRGIPSDQLTVIFDMFTQISDAMESCHQGLGIGLTLVKRLVELHGGTVDAESPGLGHGSRFCVRLPTMRTAKPGAAQNSPNGRPKQPSTSRRVLVVDDNADALKTLSLLVSALGNEVYRARDGIEAVAAAERIRPDVILMDLGMPKLNGFGAARQIREQSWGVDLLLVATTGWGQEEDRRRTKEAGFDHHLVKPVTPAQIQELLASLPARLAAKSVRHAARLSGVATNGRGAAPEDWNQHANAAKVETNGLACGLNEKEV